MKLNILVVVILGSLFLSFATAQTQEPLAALEDVAIEAAIAIGMDDDDDDLKDLFEDCRASPGFRETMGDSFKAGLTGEQRTFNGSYEVTFTSHIGQIAMIAAEQKTKYMPAPGLDEIPDMLKEPVLRVWIEPQIDKNNETGRIDLAASISHVIIRPEDREEGVVQPMSLETEPVGFSNLLGAEFTLTRALATFPADAALSAAENRDLEVVIITPAGERKCNIDNDDVLRMFGLKD